MAKSVFLKYGRHVRDLTTHKTHVLEATSGTCLALKSLTLDTISDGIPWLADTTLDSISWSEQPAVAPSFTVSASMFPEFFVVDDFVLSNIDDYESDPPETRQMRLERRWIFTQYYWHLVFSNRQLERLTFAGAVYVPWEIRFE